jgi:hypothetical protein
MDHQAQGSSSIATRNIIEINIEGLAICYKKNDLWKVLFPFDDECHRIKFSHWKGLAAPSEETELAAAGGKISITSTGAKAQQPDRSEGFDREVFDFTANPSLHGYTTHEAVRLKDGWEENTVVMEIADAFFSVGDYVNALTPEAVLLHSVSSNGTLSAGQPVGMIAHSIKATVVLPDTDAVLTVEGPNMSPLNLTGGGLFTLRFDNDCGEIKINENDMFMYYQNTIEPVRNGFAVQEAFCIGELGHSATTGKLSGGPYLLEGKPCMGGKIGNAELLP